MFNLKMKTIDDGTHYVQVEGRITQDAVAKNGDAFVEVLGDNAFGNKVILGLENVEHVDSSGVGWLLSNNRQFGQGGGKLVLHSLPPSVKNVFGMLKLGEVLSLANSEDDAKEVVKGSEQ